MPLSRSGERLTTGQKLGALCRPGLIPATSQDKPMTEGKVSSGLIMHDTNWILAGIMHDKPITNSFLGRNNRF